MVQQMLYQRGLPPGAMRTALLIFANKHNDSASAAGSQAVDLRDRVNPQLLGQLLEVRLLEDRFKVSHLTAVLLAATELLTRYRLLLLLRPKQQLDIKIQACNGLDGFGIFEGFQWMRNHKAFT